MKTSDKIILSVYIVIGIILMIIGMTIQIDYYSTLIFAMGFGLTFSSIVQLVRFHHNTKPENIEAYREKIHQQQINLKDERKIQLRNRAGYLTWAVTMVLCLVASFIAAVLHAEPWVVCLFMGLGVAEYLVATIIYKYLSVRM